jgi:TonB family protein
MALRLTSRKVEEARTARDETLTQGETDGRHDGPSARVTGDGSFGARDLGPQKKVVAADIALDWVLQEIVQQARLATTATGAFIGIVQSRKIICQATSGSNAAEFVAYLNRDRRIFDRCLAETAPLRCRDSETSQELDASTCRYLGARSVVIVPVIDARGDAREEKLGIFGVFSPQVDAFSSANIIALQTLSRRIGDAMAQVDRCTSASNGNASARRQSEAGKSSIRDRLLRAARRPLPVIRGPVAWVLGILAVVLLGGWILNRTGALSQWTMYTSAKAPASVTSPAASASSALHLSDHPSPGNSGKTDINSGQSPKVQAVVKETPAVAADGKAAPVVSKGGRKIAARSTPRVPDLEIENTLDDASSESLPAASGETSRVPSQSITAAPSPTSVIGKPAISTNAASSSVSASASAGSLPREAVHLTRAPELPRTEATPSSSFSSRGTKPGQTSLNASAASTGPELEAPIMVPQNTALERIAEQVKPDYPPSYPEDARVKNPPATVDVDVIVGKDGQVESVAPLKGDTRLMAAAAKAVAQWRFEPLPRNNRFVRFESHITVQFATP